MSKRTRRSLLLAATIGILAAWFVTLRPAYLGGPVSYVRVTGISMQPALQDGDLALVRRAATYGPGEIVAYRVPQGEPAQGGLVIHRIVGGSGRSGFRMRGDNTQGSDPWRPTDRDIVGALWLRVPAGGRMLGWIRDPATFAGLAAAFTVFAVLVGEPRRRRVGPPEEDQPAPLVPAWRSADAWTLDELSARHVAPSSASPDRGSPRDGWAPAPPGDGGWSA